MPSFLVLRWVGGAREAGSDPGGNCKQYRLTGWLPGNGRDQSLGSCSHGNPPCFQNNVSNQGNSSQSLPLCTRKATEGTKGFLLMWLSSGGQNKARRLLSGPCLYVGLRQHPQSTVPSLLAEASFLHIVFIVILV